MHQEKNKRSFTAFCKLSFTFLLVFLLIFALTACLYKPRTEILSKEEILTNIEEGSQKTYSYTAYYLDDWLLPPFNVASLREVEAYFDYAYYKDLPGAFTMAEKIAYRFLEEAYDTVSLSDRDAVTDALIRIYVDEIGDPYSVYRTREETEYYTSQMQGEYVGIGITVTYLDETQSQILISAVTDGSPAAEAGIRAGDILHSVNGTSAEGCDIDAVANLVRGEVGTEVSVSTLREGVLLSFTMTRRQLLEQTVSYRFDEQTRVGYVRVSQYKDNTDEQFIAAMDALIALGAKGYLFDMRGNPGGYLDALVNTCSYLTEKNSLIVSYGSRGEIVSEIFDTDDHSVDAPFVVLCDGYTASAGELFCAVLRDLEDATLVGLTTYKKGIMQTTYPLSSGGTITMTIAEYNPPSGVNYDGVGVIPDIMVDYSEVGDAQFDTGMSVLLEKMNKNR